MNRFETPVGGVGWEMSDRDLTVSVRRRTRRLGWTEVTAAGLVHLPDPDVPAGMPLNLLPGLGKLVDLNRREAQELRQLVLARGPSSFRALRIPIPVDEPGAMALVTAVQTKLGDRWIGEVAMEDHQAALGLSTPWWFYPLFGLGFVAFGLTILLAIGAFESLSSGQVTGVPPLAWVALLLWVILVGGILFLYRRRG
ncbi:MAG: hypothetical protein P8129_05045 [Anaerolineae bacterium]|jgi:hypothetical protein